LRAVYSGLYGGEPEVTPVLDKEATIEGIGAAINALQGEVKPGDVFVMYVSGHGRSIAGSYYFLPQDLQPDRGQTVRNDAISNDMLQTWLAKIPARKSILILDTCQSADAARGDIEQETAIERLQHAIGRSVITAASNAAFEGFHEHGVLTYAILEALTESTSTSNEEVSLYDVANYVKRRVPQISQAVWGERQEPHNIVGDDFLLGVRVAVQPAPPVEPTISNSPTHALLRDEVVREKAADDAPVSRPISQGTQVRVVTIVGKWALVAREGQKLGYVPEDSLLRLQ
jgi:uncharacterized caspase-like protein